MRILFADAVDESRLERLRSGGHECVVEPSLSSDDLAARVPGFEVLVVRSTKVTAATIQAGANLSLIVRAGAGTDNIDTDLAAERAVYVANVPGRNSTAVAELTIGLLLAVDRRIADGAQELREGTWNKAEYRTADGVFGKSIGIVGLGAIGLEVAQRAKAFGMDVIAVRKPNRSEGTERRIRQVGVRLVDSLEDLVPQCDVVSIHVPKTAETAGLVDADFLAMMRPNAILLNTARGETMVEADLLAALNGGLRAGLDVYPNEPSGSSGPFESVIAAHPNVVGSHHIGASTEQAQSATVDGTIEVIEAFETGEIRNCVNLETSVLGASTIAIRHEDKVGVLAKVFQALRTAGMNVQQMENQVFRGSRAAVATINIDGQLDDATRSLIEELPEVFGVACVDRSSNGGR